MPRIQLAVVLLAALLPVGLEAQLAGATDPLVGCYRVEIGKWIPRDGPSSERPLEPPAEFRLFAVIGSSPFERGKAIVRPLLRAQDGSGATWERVGPDSLHIAWTTGFWGTRLQMHIDGESLTGTVTSWTDAMEVDSTGQPLPSPRADAVARRVSCSMK